MPALRVVVVDDEPLARRGLELELRKIANLSLVGMAEDGDSGFDLIRSTRPDVVLLDVKMPIVDGLQLAGSLGEGGAPAIIFVTAFAQFALDAFKLAAIDYVLKPIAPDRLRAALERARSRVEQSTAAERAERLQMLVEALRREEGAGETPGAAIWVSGARGRQRLPLAEIEWFEAQRDYVRIHAGGRSCIQRGTLTDLNGKLNSEAFLRVHRSAIINLNAVAAIERRGGGLYSVRLASGIEVPVGRSYLSSLRSRITRAGVLQIRGSARG